MTHIYTILFVCTGNTCRSPMAEAALRVLLEKERPGKFKVISAGITAPTGFPATKFAAEAVKLWDGTLRDHSSQPMTRALAETVDLIIGMSPEHVREILRLSPAAVEKTYLLKNFPQSGTEGEGVDDPIGLSPDRYNQTFLEIGEVLGEHLPEFIRRIDLHGATHAVR